MPDSRYTNPAGGRAVAGSNPVSPIVLVPANLSEHGRRSPKTGGFESPGLLVFAGVRWSLGCKRVAVQAETGCKRLADAACGPPGRRSLAITCCGGIVRCGDARGGGHRWWLSHRLRGACSSSQALASGSAGSKALARGAEQNSDPAVDTHEHQDGSDDDYASRTAGARPL